MGQVTPKSGMKLGHYTLTVKLGEGILSETWLAEHIFLEAKEICVKVFTDPIFCNFLAKQKFLTVVTNPTYLPNIEDYSPTNSPAYIAQEVVSGRSLRQLLREKRRFSVDVAFNFLAKIVKALKKLHEQNVAHLDLRPEHILVNDKGNLKLLDYLIGPVITMTMAEHYKKFTTNQSNIPKPFMRSLLYKPRQQRLGKELGIKADIFALGIILFEMVTGTYPSRKALLPSNIISNAPQKVDLIYSQCCGRMENIFENCDELLESIHAKEDIKDVVSNLPGVRLLQDNIAVVSIRTLAGDKNYVDSKNIILLSASLDNIMATQLRFLAFDFQDIDYLNSSALGFLVNFSDKVKGMGGAATMFHIDKKVKTILGALGLEKVIQTADNLEMAEKQLLEIAQQTQNAS